MVEGWEEGESGSEWEGYPSPPAATLVLIKGRNQFKLCIKAAK